MLVDNANVDSAEARMRDDKRLEISGEIPFDAKRLIYGGFAPILTMGREGDPALAVQQDDGGECSETDQNRTRPRACGPGTPAQTGRRT